MKSIKTPQTVNEIYCLAGVWVKPAARSETGIAAAYLTEAAKKDENGAQKNEAKQGSKGDKKPPRGSPLCPKNIEKEKQKT
jgi:hypothetical protein